MEIKIETKPLPTDPQKAYDEGFSDGCIQVTSKLSEHPENWDGPCFCEDCQQDSNGY